MEQARHETIARLRQRIGRLEAAQRPPRPRRALGHAALDRMLGGGLEAGRLHELGADPADAGAAIGLAALFALRACLPGRTILWLAEDRAPARRGRFQGAGLAGLGGTPEAMLWACAPDGPALLAAAIEAARSPAVGVLVVECWGRLDALDLKAGRRLALAVEQSGALLLWLRIGTATSVPVATRWEVAAAPAGRLEAGAPGGPAFGLRLQRGPAAAIGHNWQIEWNRDGHCFTGPAAGPAVSGAVVSVPPGRTAATGRPRRTHI
jgi:protein ImuA